MLKKKNFGNLQVNDLEHDGWDFRRFWPKALPVLKGRCDRYI